MLHIFLVTLWLLPLSQSQETVSSIHPTSIPQGLPPTGISIFIDGSGFSSSTTYTCSWVNGAYITYAQFISSTSLICLTPNTDGWFGSGTSGTLVLKKSNSNIATAVLLFEIASSCLSEPIPSCVIYGDPHFKPFCTESVYPIQPSNKQLNLVTSKDGRFKVYGRTTPYYVNVLVSNLNAISIIGPGADGNLSPNITFDSEAAIWPGQAIIITVGGVVITNDKLPYTINEIIIGNANNWYYIEFPNKETVMWNALDTVYIYLPGHRYSQNVYGLCGEIDVQYNYCKGSNGQLYSSSNDDDLNACGNTWVLPDSSSTNVPNPQPTPNPSSVPNPQPIPNPINVPDPQPTPYPETVPNPQPIPNPDTVPVPQPTPYPETVPNPQPEPAPGPDIVIIPEPSTIPSPDIQPSPEVPLPPAYVVPDNFVSRVIKNICSSMFGTLKGVCPAGYQQSPGI